MKIIESRVKVSKGGRTSDKHEEREEAAKWKDEQSLR